MLMANLSADKDYPFPEIGCSFQIIEVLFICDTIEYLYFFPPLIKIMYQYQLSILRSNSKKISKRRQSIYFATSHTAN